MVDCKENFKFDLEVKGLNIVHAVQYSIEAFTTSGHKASVRDKLAQLVWPQNTGKMQQQESELQSFPQEAQTSLGRGGPPTKQNYLGVLAF